MSTPTAPGFPESQVRDRARRGTAAVFPDVARYGHEMFGMSGTAPHADGSDPLDAARLVPPVFMPSRLAKLVELGREPMFGDVSLATTIGGFSSPLPVFLSAFGSTELGSAALGVAVSRQAGRLGIPIVIGENVAPVRGYRTADTESGATLLARLRAYVEAAPADSGGVVVQQGTEDADAEVWNRVYSDPSVAALRDRGGLAFELKVGQGAKPGLGGMTVVDASTAARIADRYALCDVFDDARVRLRSSSPGTFTAEILRQQLRLMRNNFPRARVWVKLPPGRDIAAAVAVAFEAGADAVTVDGAEGGTGWAPRAFLDEVGLPLGECLARIGRPVGCLLATGRVWEGSRLVKCLALGVRAAGLGRAALIAVAEDPECGLVRLVEALALEISLLVSALGRYAVGTVERDDLWIPGPAPEGGPFNRLDVQLNTPSL